jgi:hypothetical protein
VKIVEDYIIALEQTAFDKKKAQIPTNSRGVIVGSFIGLDEFDSDPERLGACLIVAPHMMDTVFLDEIVNVEEYSPVGEYVTV